MSACTPEEWGNIFEEKLPLFQNYERRLFEFIAELCSRNQIDVALLESRTKSVASFVEKIRRKGNKYNDPITEITDLIGIRIVTYYKEDADLAGRVIQTAFDIDWKNSVDKGLNLDPDRVGYLSTHYVVSNPRSLGTWRVRDLKAEVQVRTVLQHAWAAIDHKIRYKTIRQAPIPLRRNLFLLSGILELADQQFSSLRIETRRLLEEYAERLKKGQLNCEIDFNSLYGYLESKEYWHIATTAARCGLDVIPYTTDEEYGKIVIAADVLGLTTLQELKPILDNAWKTSESVLARLHQELVPPIVSYPEVVIALMVYGLRLQVDARTIAKLPLPPLLQEAIARILKDGSH